ncbi:hypothetical protein F5B19DRAFT_79157 [Rostrohypoxylon terebratum]|nr:hypothetical protein F5B19DRAFT_79157 [Rostrohypoxylon terebratum]
MRMLIRRKTRRTCTGATKLLSAIHELLKPPKKSPTGLRGRGWRAYRRFEQHPRSYQGQFTGGEQKNPANVARGLKVSSNNQSVSGEAEERAKEKLRRLSRTLRW